MDAHCGTSLAKIQPRLHAGRNSPNLAMVGAVAAPVSECDAGISVISQEAPLFQELAGVSAVITAGMVGVASIGNAFGRVFWAWASDSLTRRATFIVMFLVQAVLFFGLPEMNSAKALSVVAFLILMCYGGGFGTMPAFTADYFGSRNVGPIYGLMLTAWGFAS